MFEFRKPLSGCLLIMTLSGGATGGASAGISGAVLPGGDFTALVAAHEAHDVARLAPSGEPMLAPFMAEAPDPAMASVAPTGESSLFSDLLNEASRRESMALADDDILSYLPSNGAFASAVFDSPSEPQVVVPLPPSIVSGGIVLLGTLLMTRRRQIVRRLWSVRPTAA
ncbi:MAG: hypothetical protein ACFCVE_16255 [Phycisphaerae bacterium]